MVSSPFLRDAELAHDILVGLVGIPHVNTVDASEIDPEPVDVGSFFALLTRF